ncbi:MAG: hypothetical protein ACOC2V_04230, partial [Alkalispirochaeta sp.]
MIVKEKIVGNSFTKNTLSAFTEEKLRQFFTFPLVLLLTRDILVTLAKILKFVSRSARKVFRCGQAAAAN